MLRTIFNYKKFHQINQGPNIFVEGTMYNYNLSRRYALDSSLSRGTAISWRYVDISTSKL